MLKFKYYDESAKTEHLWCDSTSIYYSRMVEDANENKGNLFVTFKTGATYLYKDVKFEDYILYAAGGTDFSQGKSLNKLIKPKYECEKIENALPIEEIDKLMLEFQKKLKEEAESAEELQPTETEEE